MIEGEISGEFDSEELVKLNITYDLGGGRNPAETAKMVKKTLKQIINSPDVDVSPEKVTIETAKFCDKWILELETGLPQPSRTNDEEPVREVVLHVCGVKADEQPMFLGQRTAKDKLRLPFQPGQTDSFDILIDDDIGDIFKLRFGFTPDVTRSSWLIKSLKLWHPKNKDTFSTEPNLLVQVSPYLDCWREIFIVWPDYPLLPVINYVVRVFTSPKSGWMECGVDMILYG